MTNGSLPWLVAEGIPSTFTMEAGTDRLHGNNCPSPDGYPFVWPPNIALHAASGLS